MRDRKARICPANTISTSNIYSRSEGLGPRPIPVFSTIDMFADVANSIYNSGTVTLRRRLAEQLFFRATYVYAKSIDESSNTGGVIAAGFPIAQNSYDLAAERGPLGFRRRPHLRRQLYLAAQVLAQYVSARLADCRHHDGLYRPAVHAQSGQFRYHHRRRRAAQPHRQGHARRIPRPNQWFDRTAFPVVPVGAFQYGNSGRNILDGPGTFALNTSLSRRFRFGETRAVQFRWEAFNLTNHTSLGLPQTDVDVLNGATISSAKAPRQMQLGLRVEF